MSDSNMERVLERVPLDRVVPPSTNVRTEFGDLDTLAASIRIHGVLAPLLLRRCNGEERYEIVAGERRYRAAQLAGVAEVPALVETGPPGAEADLEARRIAEQLAENVQRLNLTPADEMRGVQQLLELGLTDAEVAAHVVSEPEQIAALRRVLALPETARALIDEGALSLETAAQLAATEDDEIVGRALTLIGEGYHPDAAVSHARDEVSRRRVQEEARAKLVKDGVPEIERPAGYSFGGKSKTRQLGPGYDCVHVPLKQHRRQPCHAAYLNPWARSVREAIVYVCTDVTRHAADPTAGVPEQFLRQPEEVKQERAARRAEKKAWRESHEGRRAFAAKLVASLDDDAAIARIAGEVFPADAAEERVAELAVALLGQPAADGEDALRHLDERWRAASAREQLRIAVAWLTARAEAAMAREQGDWRERDNVRAHVALLAALGYEVGEGERAHLERGFQIHDLERPSLLPRHHWGSGDEADAAASESGMDASTGADAAVEGKADAGVDAAAEAG